MKITCVRAWKLCPPNDSWLLASAGTDDGLTGWGEITGSGHDAGALAVLGEAAVGMLGADPLDLGARLAPLRSFRYPCLRDKIAVTAWSGLAQALWDIRAQAFGQPLYKVLGGSETRIPLYANLNRGLFGDRSPAAHARHAEAALAEGFFAAKCTPFDEVTPSSPDAAALENGLERLRAAASAGAEKISIDCHRRFAPPLARVLLGRLDGMGCFAWVEDLLDTPHAAAYPELRLAHPRVVWAGGEETTGLRDALAMLSGPEKPDLFMPDVKYVCGLDEMAAVCRLGDSLGCRLSFHNPSGPVSQAFSAHVASAFPGATAEYPFLSVPDRRFATIPEEPVEGGAYHLSDRPGLGVAPSSECLERHGTVLFEAMP